MPVIPADIGGIERAVATLETGHPVVFPTDTVYGIGVCPAFAFSPDELYAAKGRPDGKPVAWLVGSPDALTRFGRNVPAYALDLAQRHWPGALTLVVEASDEVPPAFRGADGSIGLRMPESPCALGLIHAVGFPLATTSANLSGQPAVAHAEDLDPALAERFLCLADTDPAAHPTEVASTVVDCRGEAPVILRQGDIRI